MFTVFGNGPNWQTHKGLYNVLTRGGPSSWQRQRLAFFQNALLFVII